MTSPAPVRTIPTSGCSRSSTRSTSCAAETGKTVTQIALNWLLQRDTVSTLIIGARNEEQLVENIGATGWSLSHEQVAALDAASDVPLPYPFWHQADFPELHEKR